MSSTGLYYLDSSPIVVLQSKGINLKIRRISSQLVEVVSSSTTSSYSKAIPPTTVEKVEEERGGHIENNPTNVRLIKQ